MSHSNYFKAVGWDRAVLIHDAIDAMGKVELRAWYLNSNSPREPDFLATLHENGQIEIRSSGSAPIPQASAHYEKILLHQAGLALGTIRTKCAVMRALERHGYGL